jgi:spermidine synthase
VTDETPPRPINDLVAGVQRVLLRRAGMFGDVIVVEEDGLRYLRFGSVESADQSGIDPREPDRVLFEYIRIAALALDRHDEPKSPRRALVLGLGGGAFARLLLQRADAVVVDAVEVDPVVVDVARSHFQLPTTPRLQLHIADAAAFVQTATPGYDIVLVDGFSGELIPDALSTLAFFAHLRALLVDDGVVVMNVALVDKAATKHIIDRFASEFGRTVVMTARTEENRVIFGGRQPMALHTWQSAAARSIASLGFDVLQDVGSLTTCSQPAHHDATR